MAKAYVQGIIDFGYGILVSPYPDNPVLNRDWLRGQEVEARYYFAYYQRHWQQMRREIETARLNKLPKLYQPVYDEQMIDWCSRR